MLRIWAQRGRAALRPLYSRSVNARHEPTRVSSCCRKPSIIFGGHLAREFVGWIAKAFARRLTPGSRLSQLLRPIVIRVLGGRTIRVRVIAGPAAGIRLLINSRDEKFYWTGNHEQHLLAELRRALRPGDCLWDVGAHIGYVSCFAARYVAPGGTVVAFEPQPATRERLNRSIEANGITNIIVAPVAVGRTSGMRELFDGGASLTWSLDNHVGGEAVLVSCTTLDEAVERLPPPTVIKIDAEGLEFDVLRGGSALVKKYRPSLLVEFTNNAVVDQARAELPDYTFKLLAQNHWLLTVQ